MRVNIRKEIEKACRIKKMKDFEIYYIDYKYGSTHWDLISKDKESCMRLFDESVKLTDLMPHCVSYAQNGEGLCLFFVR